MAPMLKNQFPISIPAIAAAILACLVLLLGVGPKTVAANLNVGAASDAHGSNASGIIRVGEPFDLAVAGRAILGDTGVRLLLLEVGEPRAGCFDCPTRVDLEVWQGEEVRVLRYTFSGNMQQQAFERAMRKEAFGYRFVLLGASSGLASFRVEPAQP